MRHLVIGLGEVGSAIQKVFNCDGADVQGVIIRLTSEMSNYDILHICIPYSQGFHGAVLGYQFEYKPKFTVIHSTVPIGTSRSLDAIHSPIRGLHPNLYNGIMTFDKFIGGEQASLIADEFRKHGLKVILCDKQETTELGKLLDTEYYRACIEFTLKAKELCVQNKVPFSEAYTLFNQTYNSGYTKLDHCEYLRPVLQPIMKEIGGHCVIQNSKLI